MIRNHPEGSLLVKRCGKPVSGWARQDSCPSYFLCFWSSYLYSKTVCFKTSCTI